jgi:VanZ family protein
VEDVAPRRRSAAVAWLAPLAWGAALLLLSAQPAGRFPAGGVPHLDKLVHGALYAILGALAGRALALRAPAGRAAGAVLAAAAVGLVGFGALDEWSQGFSPGRTTSLADLAADAIGAWIGLVAASRYYQRRHGIPAQLPRR